jgi:predicted NUDIX family NTP pyrophosphohydrolase
MARQHSAGVLVYRKTTGLLEVLLAHPGGPFFRTKDEGAWSLPKGLIEEGEEALGAAIREFGEETGVELPPPGPGYISLGAVTQKSGKRVSGWAVEADLDPSSFSSNTFEMEWPPRSGRRQRFPEIDRSAYFDLPKARRKINPRQLPFLERLEAALHS